MDELSLSSQAALKAELKPGEKLLWSGSPIPGRSFLAGFAIYIFAIPWTVFSLFWEIMVLYPLLPAFIPKEYLPVPASASAPGGFAAIGAVMALFGLPFILVGFGMLASPFAGYFRAQKTFYAITDKRAFILICGWVRTVKSYPLDYLGGTTELHQNRDGSGTLYFSIRTYKDSDGDSQTRHEGFKNASDIKTAETRLLDAISRYSRYQGDSVNRA